MDEIIDLYKKSFSQFGDSPEAVQWPKGRQDVRFRELTRVIPIDEDVTVLDFGCGLAHLKEFLDVNYPKVVYSGVDMVPDFINHNKRKFPSSEFLTRDEFFTSNNSYDFIIASGVFNIRYFESLNEHEQEVFRIIQILFDRTNVVLSMDFMSSHVDFAQKNSYHPSPSSMMNRIIQEFSRKVFLNHSYLPYEYSLQIFKNDEIVRPDNIYEI